MLPNWDKIRVPSKYEAEILNITQRC